MKRLLNITFAIVLTAGTSAGQNITLKDCIDKAVSTRALIKAARTETMIAGLQTSSAKSGYLPVINFSYDYRYNAIIPSQVIPVGQFNPVPTDEKRAIKLGTPWQQNTGVSVYQPLIDLTISSRIKESRINERIKGLQAADAEKEILSEVLKTFATVWIKTEENNSARLDTIRTSRTLALLKASEKEGRTQKIDVNRAIINHNNSVSVLKKSESELIGEKIWLSYLTGYETDMILKGTFDFTSLEQLQFSPEWSQPSYDSVSAIELLRLQKDLINQQVISEKRKNLPRVGVEGFAGGNQYTDTFDPLRSDKWYGSSYAGLSVRIPIISGENTRKKVKQYVSQADAAGLRLEEEKNLLAADLMRLTEEVSRSTDRLKLLGSSILLLEENMKLLTARFEKGQSDAFEIVNQEADLMKQKSEYNSLMASTIRSRFEIIYRSGNIASLVRLYTSR